MFPELFKIGSITLYSYGFFIMLGLLIGYFYAVKEGKKLGLSQEKMSGLFLWAIVAVYFGGKLFFWFENPKLYINNPSELFKNPAQGFVFYGSFLVAALTFVLWFRKNKLNVWQMFDIVGISGALVHGFGKIGCFMAGCCHGKVCHNFWGITYTNPASHAEPLNTPLYPTQLWDAAIIFICIGIMLFLKNRKWFHGELFLIYGMFYAIGRFVTESYRGDEARGYVFNGALSHSQFIAVCIFLVCAIIFGMLYLKSKKLKEEQNSAV